MIFESEKKIFLSFLANQETLIELVSFFKEVWPDSLEKVESEVSDTSDNEDQLIASRRQVKGF